MNKEIYQEGWLTKSPPTKRIWRARWRRRWFTLKQGEIPGQFCLEYFTDRNCRKSKGTIDLDQCEQVDSGLRLEHRKQKFQNMFAIKTPQRIYYLAADTETDMRDWVNCICQVCNLHDSTKQFGGDRQYYNLCENDAPIDTVRHGTNTDTSNETTTTSLNTSSTFNHDCSNPRQSVLSEIVRATDQLSVTGTYQNNDFSYVNTEYSNRETLVCDSKLQVNPQIEYLNLLPPTGDEASRPAEPEAGTSRTVVSASGLVKKIPENLVLSNTFIESSVEPSPALSTSSGPYIPISECFSGSPKFMPGENPKTPLNNLDPKFYDTPRSYNNIGLNLTNDQSYSPKITNCSLQSKSRSGRSSPTDSESVFTDDDECLSVSMREAADRLPRPSDSSVENEAIVFTYTQRFSKLPEESKPTDVDLNPRERNEVAELQKMHVQKRKNRLVLEATIEDEKILRDLPQFSDTDNTSPAIGPRDASSCVEESYDIPRSHNLPYFKMGQLSDKVNSPDNPIAASTPNLLAEGDCVSISSAGPHSSRTLPRPHYYTNAAPTKVEGNVFRYDFIEQGELPPVNRKLKPKMGKENKEKPQLTPAPEIPNNKPEIPTKPPSIDRKLKPSVLKAENHPPLGSPSIRRSGVPASMFLPSDSDHLNRTPLPSHMMSMSNLHGNAGNSVRNSTASLISSSASMGLPADSSHMVSMSNIYGNLARNNLSSSSSMKNEHQLQYFDLDVANPPPINRASVSSSNGLIGAGSKLGLPLEPPARVPVKSSVVYNSVDFVKTEAFKRIREERKKENEGINNNNNNNK